MGGNLNTESENGNGNSVLVWARVRIGIRMILWKWEEMGTRRVIRVHNCCLLCLIISLIIDKQQRRSVEAKTDQVVETTNNMVE